MKLADISIRRPVFAIMMIASLMVFGLVSYPKIGVDLFPNVEFPFVTVTVVYPGADPASMESKVADPLEEALNTMSGIKVLKSISLESVAQILIQFQLEVKVDTAVQDVRDRVSATLSKLPAGLDPPVVQKFDVGAAPVMSLALSGALPIRDLTKLADDLVKTRVQKIPGVGAVDLVGGREREIHVLVDPARLAGHGLTVQDLSGALQAQNLELPAGRIEEGQREFAVKTKGEVRSTREIADIIVPSAGGRVRVGDVATVEDGSAEARSHSSMNGASAVALVVRKQSGSNTVEVAHQVHAELLKLEPQMKKAGVRLSVPTDNAPFIEHSIEDVKFDLWFGALLAVIVILIFLHDLRATLISALAIPTSVVATFAFIQVMGFTFNNMTMLGLSLSIGILVDDAIVVIENIHRHLELGKSPLKAAADATGEIGLAVLATTFSIIAVFVPVAIMKGIIGRFFFQFGLTVSFAVAVSLFVSFTLTPMMSSRLLRRSHEHRSNFAVRGIERLLSGIDGAYRRVLGAALAHRFITIAVAFAAFVFSIFLVTKVKTEFLPPEDRAQFSVVVELPTGTSLETSRGYVESIAADLRKNGPGVTGTFVTIGGGAQGQVNIGQIQTLLVNRTKRPWHQEAVMGWVRERYKGVKDALITVNPISAVGGDSGFKQQPIQFNIRGTDMAELEKSSQALIAELRKVPGLVDLDMSYRTGKPELSVDIDRDRAAELGVPVAAIATTLRALVAGDKVTELKEGLDLYDVTVQLPAKEKRGLASLDNLEVRGASGQLVPLSNVVKVVRGTGPSQIDRQARQRQVTIFAGLQGMPLGDALNVVNANAEKVVPKTMDTDYAGMGDIMKESFGYMLVALALAVVLVYMILAAQFDSLLHPLTIMVSLPLSLVGAFGGLFISRMTVNIYSMIGVIMLMGLVTKNAILLVDFTNHLRQQGRSTTDALMEAGAVRLRPILMTTFAMIFGMLPVALALGEGGEQRAPMAVVVIGGLITSTLLTLVVVPVAYAQAEWFVNRRFIKWFGARLGGGASTEEMTDGDPTVPHQPLHDAPRA
jgi:HAE1 family hydrophobic/amphiphilic exporter-1